MSTYLEHFQAVATQHQKILEKHAGNENPDFLISQEKLQQATLVNASVMLFDQMLWRLLRTTWEGNEPDMINQDLDTYIAQFLSVVRLFSNYQSARYIQICTPLAVSHDISEGRISFVSDIDNEKEIISLYQIAYAFISQGFPEEDLDMLHAKGAKIAELLADL